MVKRLLVVGTLLFGGVSQAAGGLDSPDAVRAYFARDDRRLLLGAGVARASLIWEQLEPIAERAGVPPATFFAVAMAESQFNPHAVSPTGAEGMWQFTPATGLDYAVPDRGSRFDPVRSATAAARYLARLKERFGDWDLAVAAYNLGPTALASTLRRTGAGSWAGVRSHVRAETRDYVPKVNWIAATLYPAFRQGTAIDWGVRVVVAGQGDTWFGLAQRYGVDLAEVRLLNRGELRIGTPVAIPPIRRTLQVGESLHSIAMASGLPRDEVLAANEIAGVGPALEVGAIVRLPVFARPGGAALQPEVTR